ncbi:MAG: alpha-galactosidase [Clostridia bacterium]|nr:alpha-galactosidase [Clostridia bacterium]
MPISYDSERKLFKLDTSDSSYVMEIYDENYLVHLYYGAKIPDANLKSHKYRGWFASVAPQNIHIEDTLFSPDVSPFEYPCEGTGDMRESAFSVRNAQGNNSTDLRYVSHRIYPGKPRIDGLPSLHVNSDSDADTLEITMADSVTGVRAELYYTVFNEFSAMTRFVKVFNDSDSPVDIERIFSSCTEFNTHDYDMITLYGDWSKERTFERAPLTHIRQGISSKRGTSSHAHNPFGAIAEHCANEEYGSVYGFNLVYSGNFEFSAEVEPHGGTRVLMGINPEAFGWRLESGECFSSPEAVSVYSAHGLGEMSRTFHKLYQKHLIRGRWADIKRPLLINNWEATGMDFTGDKLVTFAERAKELGIDMLVMDDGWFGNRDSDRTALGDWQVNEEKLGGPLSSFIARINSLGIKFGIWYEPEMISHDSNLYREHPDWCIQVPGREKSIARYQYVLDFTRKEVRDYIYSLMKKVIGENNIEYVKWDSNRSLSEVGSLALPPERQKEVAHRFILGTYEVMDRLTVDFPHLLLENCSSGGGRFDPGMLYFSPQIWCSDNTDPIDRLHIQFGTSLCYPASTVGAHVSASRRAGYETKGNVALWGTFGYELDPNTFTEEDREIIKEQVSEYHKYYDLIRSGDLYRLISPWENERRVAWMFVSEDKEEALLTSVVMRKPYDDAFYLRLRGLDPEKYYVDDNSGEVYSGALLMNAGINLTNYGRNDGDSFKIYFHTL